MTCLFVDSPTTLRITRLDDCGTPVAGADDGSVLECFSSLDMALVTDDIDRKIFKNAAGKICAVKPPCRSLLGYDVTMTLQAISPEIIDILTGQPLVMGFDATPIGWDDCDIKCVGGFGLEIWTGLVGPCTTTPEYLYFLLPWIQGGVLGDISLNADLPEITLTGSTRAGGGWARGPYDVVLNGPTPGTPGPLLTPLGDTCHRRIMRTTVPPPAASVDCGYSVVPANNP